ncbi:MAG TPA: hypothetical protein VLF93_04745 [Candidatus Saccharimonadales bacterium]|nr:hypothetical protein [Candidatus Saccharimonadales bacterium]
MNETGAEVTEQTPPEEIKSLQDLGEKIIESNPKLWGRDSEFSIFETSNNDKGEREYVTEEKDGKTGKVIDQTNFLKWTKLQLSDDPEDISQVIDEKKSKESPGIFRRNTQAPTTQITRMHYGDWTGHIEDMIKFSEYNSKTGLRFKRKEYQEAMKEKVEQANRIKLELAA